jgi:hypothetical protein
MLCPYEESSMSPRNVGPERISIWTHMCLQFLCHFSSPSICEVLLHTGIEDSEVSLKRHHLQSNKHNIYTVNFKFEFRQISKTSQRRFYGNKHVRHLLYSLSTIALILTIAIWPTEIYSYTNYLINRVVSSCM